MEYRKLDKLGINISLLGFGCMRLPLDKESKIDYKRAEQMVDTAYRGGVNYFDTAYIYHSGDSELFIGKALEKYDRDSYYIADKLPCWLVNSLEDAERIFDDQLKKLNRDHIDFYLLHALSKESFDKMVSLGIPEFCDRLKAEGKIQYFGFSFHDEYEAFEYILKYRDWDFCQIQLNYMDTDIQAGMNGYQLAEELQIPVVVMEPVKGGTLATIPDSVTKYFNEITPEQSAASWALRWVGSLPYVKIILSGMTTEEQVEDNLKTFDQFQELNTQEQQAIQKAVAALKQRVKNGCTGCAYCMPCPAGVNIPKNFHIWNNYGMYNSPDQIKWMWFNEIKEEEKAKNCISCGECEEVCPQSLTIREHLSTLQSELELACK